MKRFKFFTTALLMCGIVFSTSTVAFAGGGPETTEIPISTTETPITTTEIPITEDNTVVEIEITETEKEQTKPLTPDEAIEAFRNYIDQLARGKERDKIRIILK